MDDDQLITDIETMLHQNAVALKPQPEPFLNALAQRVRETPLHALMAAFLIGVILARR